MDAQPAPALDVWRLWPWGVALHVVLPVLMAAGWSWSADAMIGGWLAIHLLFPAVLVVTFPWWRGQGEAVVLMLLLNHLVTFATLAAIGILVG